MVDWDFGTVLLWCIFYCTWLYSFTVCLIQLVCFVWTQEEQCLTVVTRHRNPMWTNKKWSIREFPTHWSNGEKWSVVVAVSDTNAGSAGICKSAPHQVSSLDDQPVLRLSLTQEVRFQQEKWQWQCWKEKDVIVCLPLCPARAPSRWSLRSLGLWQTGPHWAHQASDLLSCTLQWHCLSRDHLYLLLWPLW